VLHEFVDADFVGGPVLMQQVLASVVPCRCVYRMPKPRDEMAEPYWVNILLSTHGETIQYKYRRRHSSIT
jgi:hypothetical protein